MKRVECDIKDLNLAEKGKKRILWAQKSMPVLQIIREDFKKRKPLKNVKISACLHVTAETANLMLTLKEAGADILLCASNPLSTQDDIAAALVKYYKIKVFAIKGENTKKYYSHIKSAIQHAPQVVMDDGADLVSTIHKEAEFLWDKICGATEETTTGVIRLKAMAKDKALKFPVIAVNDAQTKYLFDNRYGTGQSTVDGIIRATDILLAGKTAVVAGYGWCARGVANRLRGMGANVIVTEVDSVKALEAAMDGFRVMPMKEAAKEADLLCTLTGNINVIREEHFKVMKNGAIICNSGHFNVEIDIKALNKMAKKVIKNVKEYVDEYIMPDGRSLYLLGEGRLINLAAAEGHPAAVMDMSFSLQALSCEYCFKNKGQISLDVHKVPTSIDNKVAELKLKTMGIKIDTLTPEQKKYLSSWKMGT